MLMKLLRTLHVRYCTSFAAMWIRRAGGRVGKGLVCQGLPIIALRANSQLLIGNRVVLCSSSRFTALGVAHPTVIRTLRPGAVVVIEDDVGISGASICAAEGIRIGAGTLLGADVVIADTDFHPVRSSQRRYASPELAARRAVSIGRNCFIGTRVTVLKGVAIGDNTVVGAGSVVTRDIPANSIAVGNPCRVIGSTN